MLRTVSDKQFIYSFAFVDRNPGSSRVPVGCYSEPVPLPAKATIQNERREDVLRISGPCIVCSCCTDIDFEVRLDNVYRFCFP